MLEISLNLGKGNEKPPKTPGSSAAQSGVYSNTEIKRAVKEDHIICIPYDPKHISHSSLDVTLGYYYYRTERITNKPIYNPFNESDVKRYFAGPYEAVKHKDWCAKNGVSLQHNIPASHPVIPLLPGERVLAHTHEFFGIKPPGAYEIKSRSSWGRSGIAVAFDAGWVDPGYFNRLTLEVFNLNQHEMMLLPVGERIAQAVFYHTGEVEGSYGEGRDSGFSGKYQLGSNIDELIKKWEPSMMLPRAYLDKRHLPKKIKGLKAK